MSNNPFGFLMAELNRLYAVNQFLFTSKFKIFDRAIPHSMLFKIEDEPESKKSFSILPFLSIDHGIVPFAFCIFKQKLIEDWIVGHSSFIFSLSLKILK
jgi:hypothetical protein